MYILIKMALNKKKFKIFFIYLFVISHIIIWTLVPSFTNNNLPLDTIEALAWGSNLDWGFNKHPPAECFFVEIFSNIWSSRLGFLSIKFNICCDCFLLCI